MKLDVDVDTKDGVVTLRGKVSTEDARQEAEKLARATEGVKGVRNELVVGDRDFGGRADEGASDSWIRAQVGTKLTMDPEVRRRWSIDIDVVDGVVTLSGSVKSTEDKAEAEDLARKTEGVRDVINELDVVPNGD